MYKIFSIVLSLLLLISLYYNSEVLFNKEEYNSTSFVDSNKEENTNSGFLDNTGSIITITNEPIVINNKEKNYLLNVIEQFSYSNYEDIDLPKWIISPDEFELIQGRQIRRWLAKCINVVKLDINTDEFLNSISDDDLTLFNYIKDNKNINKIMSYEDVHKIIWDKVEYDYDNHIWYLYKLWRISKDYYINEIDKLLINYKDYNRFNTYNLNDQDIKIILVRDMFLWKEIAPELYCKEIFKQAIK